MARPMSCAIQTFGMVSSRFWGPLRLRPRRPCRSTRATARPPRLCSGRVSAAANRSHRAERAEFFLGEDDRFPEAHRLARIVGAEHAPAREADILGQGFHVLGQPLCAMRSRRRSARLDRGVPHHHGDAAPNTSPRSTGVKPVVAGDAAHVVGVDASTSATIAASTSSDPARSRSRRRTP